MNEVIGAKGSSNDRRRYFIRKSILKKIKKQYLEEQKRKLKNLEKKVKKQQIFTFIKAMSIVFPLGIIDVIVKNNSKNKHPKNVVIHKKNIEKTTGNKVFKEDKKNIEIANSIKIVSIEKKKSNIKKVGPIKTENSSKVKQEKENKISKVDKKIVKKKTNNKKVEHSEKIKNINVISRIRNKQIIGYYEDKFKEQRTEVKKITYEYNNLKKKNIEMNDIDELEKMRDSLNLLIERLEKLENVIYEGELPSEYFYNFIDDYIKKIRDDEVIETVEDSKLFVMISNELSKVENIISEKKESISSINNNLEIVDNIIEPDLKFDNEEYFVFEKFNNDLSKFQDKQEKIVDYIEKNMPDIKEVDKKVKVKIGLMNLECALLFSFILTASMKRPSVRTTKAMAISTLVGVYFMNQIMKDKYTKDNLKEKELKKEEYEQELEQSIRGIDDTLSLIYKTTGEIDKLINSIKVEYEDYVTSNVCSELLENLFTIKRELMEKEYELLKLKQQENKIKKNNFKEYKKEKNKVE